MRRRKHRISTQWNSNLAYAIGLITSDGSLSFDGRHITLTSKDEEMIVNFQRALQTDFSVGMKARGGEKEKKYYVVQFSDVRFYRFLVSLGLSPAKSRTIQSITVPDEHFADFLRGCIDGDGNIQTYTHPESKNIQVRISLCSGSKKFLEWTKTEARRVLGMQGGSLYTHPHRDIHSLSFGKADSLRLFRILYSKDSSISLGRKRHIAEQILGALIAGASR